MKVNVLQDAMVWHALKRAFAKTTLPVILKLVRQFSPFSQTFKLLCPFSQANVFANVAGPVSIVLTHVPSVTSATVVRKHALPSLPTRVRVTM